MNALELLRAALPEEAKDIKLNLSAVLTGPSTLTPAQRWGIVGACAAATRNGRALSAKCNFAVNERPPIKFAEPGST